MSLIVCPHCGNRRIVLSKVPKDVVVVLPCPSCREFVVLFRGKIIALSREVLASGSREQRITHIAEVITEFLEAGILNSMFALGSEASEGENAEEGQEPADEDSTQPERPISQDELDRFVKVDLQCLDDTSYFRKHFG